MPLVEERGPPSFTAAERRRFRDGLLSFGYGRWNLIKEYAQLDRWSLRDIAAYAQAFMSLFEHLQVDDPLSVLQNTHNTPARIDICPDVEPADPQLSALELERRQREVAIDEETYDPYEDPS